MYPHRLVLCALLVACNSPGPADTTGTDAASSETGAAGATSTGGDTSSGSSESSESGEPPTTGEPPPTLAVASVEDLGLLPLPSEVAVGRDGGQSGVLAGKLLWTFGDTFLTAKNPVDGSNVLSATGAWATPGEPLALVQPVDGGGFPAQLIPYTDAELAQNELDALDGWALWPGMMVDTGADKGLVFFKRIKRTDGMGYDSMGVGMARIAVDATVAERLADDLFAPPEPLFMPGVVLEGQVYAFACDTIAFLKVGCKLARAPATSADQRAAYEFHDGAGWQADIAAAAVLFEEFAGPPSFSYNAYLQRYLAVSGKLLASTVELRTATAVEGPWSEPVSIEAGDSGYLAPLDAKNAFNYIIREQPTLGPADGRSIVISYSRPTEPFRGDVRLAKIIFE